MMAVAGRFAVAADHPSLPGHFPGRPVVPGVVLLDYVAALVLREHSGRRVGGFAAVRFVRPVRPGDVVEVGYEAGAFSCRVEGAVVASGRLELEDGR